MKRIVDPYTIRPVDLQSGDVMIRTVVCHIMPSVGRPPGRLAFRLYVAPYPPGEHVHDGVPQGPRLEDWEDTEKIARALFPVLYNAEIEQDL